MARTHANEPVLILQERVLEVPGAISEGEGLWLPLASLEEATGWSLRPEGACRQDVCVPIPEGERDMFLREQCFNLVELAARLGQPIVHDDAHDVWGIGEAGALSAAHLESLAAPEFTLPDLEGRLHSLSDYRGQKVVLACWASWCGCRRDLPVWQELYAELGPRNLLPVAVAFDTRGADAARPWIDAAHATYPCLIDRQHVVAGLYDIPNVPYAVWIDEEGRMVRPPEPAGATDAFRAMDRTTGELPPAARAELQGARHAYLDAIRDWAARGPASRFALAPEEVRRRLAGPSEERACALVHFRVGAYLWQAGDQGAGRLHLEEARRLHPESWALRRQTWDLEDPALASGPDFWAAVDALGDEPYYAPVRLEPADR
ncbi:MAG: TlpA family protein disulfide reductase [Dehalococcoidia bacterium]|nr:TlpA family protein disulfide reductase [Dehalococcoidia bacterium]